MKRKYVVLISLLLILALCLAACGGNDSPAPAPSSTPDTPETAAPAEPIEKIVLNLNSSNPATHKNYTNAMGPWSEMVAEETNGQIEIIVHHSLALGPSKTVWSDVNSGMYEIGFCNMPFFVDTELYPFSIGLLPFAFPDSVTAANVMNKFAQEFSGDIFDDTVLLGIGSTDPYVFYSKTPITSVADLSGMKIRVPGTVEGAVMEKAGATPASIALEEIYESVSKNVVNAAVYTPVGALSVKLYEVAPYVTTVGLSVVPYLVIMNRDAFDQLTPELQEQMITDLGPRMPFIMSESYLNESGNALQAVIDNGGEVMALSDEEQAKLISLAAPQWDEWVETANSKGYPGQEMMDRFIELLEEEGVVLPF